MKMIVSGFQITSFEGVFATLATVAAVFLWLEKKTGWRFFQFMPPLIFIYFSPLVLSNLGVLPTKSPVYDAMRMFVLPMLLVLLLLKMNLRGAVRILGRGLGVMLFGTLGVMVGAAIGWLCVKHWLQPDMWKAYGALSASWVGGSANMAAVAEMVRASGMASGLALVADAGIAYLVWLPILIGSRQYADSFARFTGAAPDPPAAAYETPDAKPASPTTRDYLLLICVALLATWAAAAAADRIVQLAAQWFASSGGTTSELNPLLDTTTWNILLITTLGIALSFTPLSRTPGSHELAMALLFLYVARMGATAVLTGVAGQVVPFLAGALICIFIHGAFCIFGAKLFRTSIHTAAIASGANIGGPATATIVAEYHDPNLLPAAILMALIGAAIGNYTGYATALICRQIM
jgi:uncharacterized membrane protein